MGQFVNTRPQREKSILKFEMSRVEMTPVAVVVVAATSALQLAPVSVGDKQKVSFLSEPLPHRLINFGSQDARPCTLYARASFGHQQASNRHTAKASLSFSEARENGLEKNHFSPGMASRTGHPRRKKHCHRRSKGAPSHLTGGNLTSSIITGTLPPSGGFGRSSSRRRGIKGCCRHLCKECRPRHLLRP